MAKPKFKPKHLYHKQPEGSYSEPVFSWERKPRQAARGTVARTWQDVATAASLHRPRVIHNHEGSEAKRKAAKSLMKGGASEPNAKLNGAFMGK